MFPLLPEKTNSKINDLYEQILASSTSLAKGIHPKIVAEISEFMFAMNSYYTNAMEGNPSRLKDIDAALNNHFASDTTSRNFQLEHLAHIHTQKKMSARLKEDKSLNICSAEFLCWLHKTFYEALPDAMRVTKTESGKNIPVVPGAIRDQGVVVGRHHPPERKVEIESCLDLFAKRLNPSKLIVTEKLLALASSHHRLLWIHPFSDGNGRVARLFSLAFCERIGIASGHLWSVARAFARNRSSYERHLIAADQPPRNSFDGRGPLSEEGLLVFCEYFLTCCLDQVTYTAKLLELDELESRYKRILKIRIAEKTLSKSAVLVMERIFYQGEIKRGDVQTICNVKERRATQIIRELLNAGLVRSTSAHGFLRLRITFDLAPTLFPELV